MNCFFVALIIFSHFVFPKPCKSLERINVIKSKYTKLLNKSDLTLVELSKMFRHLDPTIKCPICYHIIDSDEVIVTGFSAYGCNIKHIYHQSCLNKWIELKDGNNCPVCGKKRDEYNWFDDFGLQLLFLSTGID